MEAIHCSLCNSKMLSVTRRYKISDLEEKWNNDFGFNPFLQESNHTLLKVQCSRCRLIFYHPALHSKEGFYERLSKKNWYYEENKWEFEEAIKIIFEYNPASVLEIGCGQGYFLEKARYLVESIEGVEINQDALDICESKSLTVSSVKLDEMNKQFDMIVLFEVLEHLDDVLTSLNDIKNLLLPNGLLLIAVPNPDSYLKDFDSVLLDLPPHHYTSWSTHTFKYIEDLLEVKQIAYLNEPLRYIHYLDYLLNLSFQSIGSKTNSFFYKVQRKVISFVIKIFAPFYFPMARTHLVGQTHLVVFQKN